jgi:hypothetical protein
MKSLSVKLGVILIGLAIFGCAEVWGEDWKLYDSNEDFLSYYDAQRITRPSKNIVRVWTKLDYTEKGVLGRVGKLGKKFENLSHSINLSEINCVKKTRRLLSRTDYDNKGDVIISSPSPLEWTFIIPGSMAESLYKEVCK